MKQLKVAVLGLSGAGGEYLASIQADPRFRLIAVADSDGETLRRVAESAGTAAYDDYRSLIVESDREGLDLLFVALAPFRSVELIQLAAKLGIGVFHQAPFARTCAEAAGLVERFSGNDRPLVVSRWWRFEPAFVRLGKLEKYAGHIFAAAADVRTAVDGRTGWRGDLARAGGGVLLNGAYQQVDMLVELLGAAQEVTAFCSYAAEPASAKAYDTEDAVVVSMRFSGGRIGTVTAARTAHETAWKVTLMGTKAVVDVSAKRMSVTDTQEGRTRRSIVRSSNRYAAEIRALADYFLGDGSAKPSTADSHLATMAVIEAAYLSAKTGSAEVPARFME